MTWAELTWPTWVWSLPETVKKGWQSVTGIGYAAAMRMQISTSTLQVRLLSIDYMFEPGGAL